MPVTLRKRVTKKKNNKTNTKTNRVPEKKTKKKKPVETEISTTDLYKLMSKNAITHDTPIAIFTMGIPGSGKSTVSKLFINKLLSSIVPLEPTSMNNLTSYNSSQFIKCNPDEIMPYLKGYKIGKEHKYLPIASRKTAGLLNRILGNQLFYSFIYDGTGSNINSYKGAIKKTKGYGYTIILLNITVPVETAVERASKRDRVVSRKDIEKVNNSLNYVYPESNKQNYGGKTKYDIYTEYADISMTIDNSKTKPLIVESSIPEYNNTLMQ